MSNSNDKFIRYDNFVINFDDSNIITNKIINMIDIKLKENPFIINFRYRHLVNPIFTVEKIVSISRFVNKDKSIIYYLSTSQSDKLKEELPKVKEFLIQTYEH